MVVTAPQLIVFEEKVAVLKSGRPGVRRFQVKLMSLSFAVEVTLVALKSIELGIGQNPGPKIVGRPTPFAVLLSNSRFQPTLLAVMKFSGPRGML